ncbi:metallophosphoesterase [Pedosphaera parvula Ellin514]|uniref:Metallophosphoesterase n=1 Tax=Pedosphaera parvula (strain Ellin514) TaxID=320771 RepID=B9XRM9_PEDPL|nr:metallophosphoesterase [Pedosphaera parvula Ellin514]
MKKPISHDHSHDGIDRRGFLECMAWVGTGIIYSFSGGILRSQTIGETAPPNAAGQSTDFTFVQISDSHIGFNRPPNKDVTATFKEAVDKINAMPQPPDFIIHTGDLSHLSKPSEFDTVDQVLKSAKTSQIFYVPGEHDVLTDTKDFLERYGKNAKGDGWYSFDHKGVHFIGLVNVVNLKAGGLGLLGPEQLEWLKNDVANLSTSTPIVVFAHIPLWAVYPDWGWGTDDGMQAISYLRRFGSVSVLNGHIHQIMQKVEGNITFHTALATAFPQPRPGKASGPGPIKDVPPDKLRSMLGYATVNYVQGKHPLAVIDSTLAGTPPDKESDPEVKIDNFTFTPKTLTIHPGETVTWINRDDVPHKVVSVDKKFASQALDTDQKFSHTFTDAGTYKYYCSIHPRMTGTIVVK